MREFLNRLVDWFSGKTTTKSPLRLVIGLNQVDKMIPNGWNQRLNAPTDEA